jgi:hypothetical protein
MAVGYYLLNVIDAGGEPPPPEVRERLARSNEAFVEEVRAAGVWVFGGRLDPPNTAGVARMQGDGVLVTDGPFVEGKEHVAGILVIDVPDRAAALDWARKQARACGLPIEVRPFGRARLA